MQTTESMNQISSIVLSELKENDKYKMEMTKNNQRHGRSIWESQKYIMRFLGNNSTYGGEILSSVIQLNINITKISMN